MIIIRKQSYSSDSSLIFCDLRECFISTKGYILPTSVYAVILIVTQLKYNVTCEMFHIHNILFHIRLLAFKMRKVIFIKQFSVLYTLVLFDSKLHYLNFVFDSFC